MKIGRELYEAKSNEVKAKIDQIHDQQKEHAIATQTSSTFTTDEERREAMQRFEE